VAKALFDAVRKTAKINKANLVGLGFIFGGSRVIQLAMSSRSLPVYLFVALSACFTFASGHAEELTGIPRVVDGDTTVLNGVKIRLEGIDAPESDQFSCLQGFRADMK
jgi:endonuclease YncB( thermonuclease family)